VLLADSFLERNGTLFQILATVLLAALGGLGGWWLRSRNKQSKTFDYRVASDVAILSHRPNDNELHVTYMGEELYNPRVVRVQFANTGTKVIRPSEILEQYVLTVHNAWLVSSTMVHSSRASLATFEAASSDTGEHTVRLTLATLNPGDNFTLQLIVDSENPVKTSISGCAEEETRPPGWLTTERHRRLLTVEVWSSLVGALFMVSTGVLLFLTEKGKWFGLAAAAVLTIAGLLTGFGSLGAFSDRRRRVKHGLPGPGVVDHGV
jgi:hypothetical protein